MAILQAGGFLNAITGSQPVSSQIISALIMAEGNGSGGGASDDAGGDPHIEKPFNASFSSFMRSYFNIPSF